MDKIPENFGALYDARRAKMMSKSIDWDWDKFRKNFVKKDIDPSYQYLLKQIFQIIEAEEKNDVEVDISPEYGPLVGNHKEHGSSSTLEAENNNVIENERENIDQAPPGEKETIDQDKKNAEK